MLGFLHPFWKWSTLKFKKLVLYTISFWNHVNHTKVGMQLTSIEIHTAFIAESVMPGSTWLEGKDWLEKPYKNAVYWIDNPFWYNLAPLRRNNNMDIRSIQYPCILPPTMTNFHSENFRYVENILEWFCSMMLCTKTFASNQSYLRNMWTYIHLICAHKKITIFLTPIIVGILDSMALNNIFLNLYL